MILQITVFVAAITALAFMAMSFPKYKRVQLDGGSGYRVVKLPNALLVVLIAILLIGISGHRGFSYQDTGEYVYSYVYSLFDDIDKCVDLFKDNWLFWLGGIKKIKEEKL